MKALVLHGFTGSLETVNPLKTALEAQGLKVSMPVLRGHGSVPENLFRVHWRDWVADARAAFLELAPKDDDPVVIAGLSMGALVGCILAAEFPQKVHRLALLAPAFRFRSKLVHAIPLLKKVYVSWSGKPEFADPELLGSINNYPHFPIEAFEQTLALTRVAEDILALINCPVAVYYSKKDPIIPPVVLRILERKLAAGISRKYLYKKSFHELLCDVEGEAVCQDVAEFLQP
ncbi:MAG: alpha/beta fold hydrolase [Vulcanimicrobiota bacterium]